jgi:hypothetical protein
MVSIEQTSCKVMKFILIDHECHKTILMRGNGKVKGESFYEPTLFRGLPSTSMLISNYVISTNVIVLACA